MIQIIIYAILLINSVLIQENKNHQNTNEFQEATQDINFLVSTAGVRSPGILDVELEGPIWSYENIVERTIAVVVYNNGIKIKTSEKGHLTVLAESDSTVLYTSISHKPVEVDVLIPDKYEDTVIKVSLTEADDGYGYHNAFYYHY